MKQYRVVYDPAALADLKEIFDHILDTSSEASALAYAARVEKFCAGLDQMPERFPAWRTESPNLRIASFRRFFSIAYEISGDRVLVLRVLAKGRNALTEF